MIMILFQHCMTLEVIHLETFIKNVERSNFLTQDLLIDRTIIIS